MMSENDSHNEILFEEWKRMMSEGITETLVNYELLEQINFDPANLIPEQDERTWRQLSVEEKQWITDDLFRAYGFNRRNEVVLAEYTFEPPVADDVTWKGVAKVKVFETHRTKLENMCLHEITWPDGEVEFLIAPETTRL